MLGSLEYDEETSCVRTVSCRKVDVPDVGMYRATHAHVFIAKKRRQCGSFVVYCYLSRKTLDVPGTFGNNTYH